MCVSSVIVRRLSVHASLSMQLAACFLTVCLHVQARFYLALTRLHELESKLAGADLFDRILVPGKRGDLLNELAEGLTAMARGFGDEHMLVRKARGLEKRVA